MTEIILFNAIFLLSYIGVEIFRRWSLRKEIIDIPNERSSHTRPTPRGGGLVIVAVILTTYSISAYFGKIHFNAGFFGGSLLIALISWLDDIISVSFVWRFLIHSFAALIFIFTSGYFDIFGNSFFPQTVAAILGIIFTYLWIVWLTNAYNFMDGIDGIAGIQAVSAGFGWFLIGRFTGMENASLLGGIICFTSLGFLIHNWQPAKIFMGDVGSAFLGFSFAVIPLLKNEGSKTEQYTELIIGTVLIWLFLFDTIFTFIKRLLKKQKVWHAHREHIYQILVISGKSHKYVTKIYGIVSLLNASFLFILIYTKSLKLPLIFVLLFIQTAVLLFYYLKQQSSVR